MIIEFKVANYRSINEEQTLSFVADRATRHPHNLIKRPGYRLLKAIGLFGANASGKSNLVKALSAMAVFVRASATKMNDGDPILSAEPYRLDPGTRNGPSLFQITFVTDGTVYTYGFAADSKRVREEWLTATQESNGKRLFDIKRSTHDTLDGSVIDVRGLSPMVCDLLDDRTRDNALFLSTAARENVKELLAVYHFFRDDIRVHDMSDESNTLFNHAVEHCKDDKILRSQVSLLLRDADVGIENILIEEMQIPKITHHVTPPPGVSEELQQAIVGMISGKSISVIMTEHKDSTGEVIRFSLKNHGSLGTNRLFTLATPLLVALRNGTLITIDELDASMHPLLTRKLLELFQSPEANPNGAQLLFTTHDPSLLDQGLFRRDQIWLVEKCNGASTFFSLADIQPPIRNTESFLGNYLAGRYGGTPHLGPAFEMVETGSKA